VDSVRAVVDRGKGRLFLFLQGEGERELEEWTVRAKSELLRDVFDLDVVLSGALPPQDGSHHPSAPPNTSYAKSSRGGS
jgi:exopolyphosphatase / guanosine-5'-triphosphate,3'-diphosphate pyrophosphatase